MKEMVVPIDKAGRVVLPKIMRAELALNAGDKLTIRVTGNSLTLSPCKRGPGFLRKGTGLVFSAGGGARIDAETISAVLVEQRDRRGDEMIAQATGRKRKS